MVRVLDASGMTFEIITVSDGSTDGSPFTLDGFPESVVRRISFDTNVGKGHALRVGLGMGRGRYLGFIDADGDISPEFLAPFVSIMQSRGARHHHRQQAAPRLLRALPAAAAAVLVGLPAPHPPAVPPERQGHPGRDQAGRPQGHRRRPPAAAREPLRPRPGAAGAGPPPRLHPHRRGAGRGSRSGSGARSRSRPSGCSSSTRSASSSASPCATSTTPRWRPGQAGRPPSGPRLSEAAARADAADGGRTLDCDEPVQLACTDRRTEDQVPHDPTAIRNVALVGHHGAGKTTLAEALLAATGSIARRGSVEKGTTVMDFEPEEVSRQLSISTSLAPFTVNGVKVNLLDTPGYADFAGEMVTALANVDLAVVVVSATDGVQAQTEDAWRAAARLGRAAGHRHQQARPRAGRLRPHAGRDPCVLRRRRRAGGAAHRARGRLPRRHRPARRHRHPLRHAGRRRGRRRHRARPPATRGPSPTTWSTRSTPCTSSWSRASSSATTTSWSATSTARPSTTPSSRRAWPAASPRPACSPCCAARPPAGSGWTGWPA